MLTDEFIHSNKTAHVFNQEPFYLFKIDQDKV